MSDTDSTPTIPTVDFLSAIDDPHFSKFPFELEGFAPVRSDEGVRKLVLRPGEGETPEPKSTVECRYVGRVAATGAEFDRSLEGYPFSFKLNENKVIPGWEKGVSSMLPGELALIWVTSDLAYGPNGSGDPNGTGEDIAPDSDLVFLVDFVDSKLFPASGTDRQETELERLAEVRLERAEAAAKRALEKQAKEERAKQLSEERAKKLSGGGKKGKKGGGKGKNKKHVKAVAAATAAAAAVVETKS